MIAFLCCDRNHPDKTEIFWAINATSACRVACKALHLSASQVILERVPELDGVTECTEVILDTYRLQMMDRFPVLQRPMKVPIPDEWANEPVLVVQRKLQEPEDELTWEIQDNFPKRERLLKPRDEKKSLPKKDVGEPKSKPKEKIPFQDDDRDEWGNKL
jgi:hypothetical protein